MSSVSGQFHQYHRYFFCRSSRRACNIEIEMQDDLNKTNIYTKKTIKIIVEDLKRTSLTTPAKSECQEERAKVQLG